MKALAPTDIRKPFGRYAHGVEIPPHWRIVRTSGQLGIRVNGTIPEDTFSQAVVCFENAARILQEAGMAAKDVAHVSAFVTHRNCFPDYMRARDEFIGGTVRLPTSTLLIVSGFTRPEFKVEIEVLAAAP